MRTRPRVVLAALVIVLFAGMGGAAALIYTGERALPVYALGTLPPSHGYANNTLTMGGVTYVSGRAEFRLRPLAAPAPARPIGRTDGDWRIYLPAGQTSRNYIYATGEMMPQMVYRDSRLPAPELGGLRVSEVRFYKRTGNAAYSQTQDAQLIAEVMATLRGNQAVTVHPNYDAGDQGYRLELLSEQIPGLAYVVDTLLTRDGKVYLSTETELAQDLWIPAGELFTRWTYQR